MPGGRPAFLDRLGISILIEIHPEVGFVETLCSIKLLMLWKNVFPVGCSVELLNCLLLLLTLVNWIILTQNEILEKDY